MVVPIFEFINLLAGMIYGLGFPSLFSEGIFLAPVLSCTLLFLTLEKTKTFKRKLINLLLFSLSFNLFSYYWIPQTLIEFGEMPKIVAYLLGLFFSLIILPHFWAYILIEHLLKKFNKLNQWWEDQGHSFKILFLAFLFTTLEYYTPQQFPGHLGHNWLTIAPYLGLAPIGGVPIFSLMSYVLTFFMVDLFARRKPKMSLLIIFILFLIANISFPLKKHSQDVVSLKVRVIQPNVGNFLKISSEKGDAMSIDKVLKNLYDLSTIPSGFTPNLIIWPETAYPFSIHSESIIKNKELVPDIFKKIIDDTKANVFFGGYDQSKQFIAHDETYETEFNSSFLINPNKELKHVYHKRRLIPFGETLPIGPLKASAAKIIKNLTYFAEGKSFERFRINNEISFISPICYEVLFSHFIRNFLRSENTPAQFILNITNDSWYGLTKELDQHLFLAKWRSLEFAIPMIRSTNTGITSIIYPDGSESKRLLIHQSDLLEEEILLPKNKNTLYLRYGFEVVTAFWLLLIFLFYFLEKPSFRRS